MNIKVEHLASGIYQVYLGEDLCPLLLEELEELSEKIKEALNSAYMEDLLEDGGVCDGCTI